ncbi:heavy metal-binding domain-containing protein (plasmid) [Nicoliella spurrieriana]|uniref:UPF0145 protein MOO44_01520 n=1 Tax=Nicoliella spurrieriana TaxID=2925830 RepID=A0A976X4W9_9LACO|nr:heavy metal-binding domain-containing protein [Nicoliella spurrieriana]UQS86026.1 heavy metal-binding domain-containing protein [Nicoliella spurrieriana]
MLVSTTEHIGKEYEVIGEVFGMTTQSRNIGSNLAAGIKNIFGGEIKGYTQMMEDARDESVQRLKENAKKMGADAVVMMRFDSGSIGNDMQSVAAYGTAVKYVDERISD